MSDNNHNRFRRETVVFTQGLSVDGYETPSGEFRVGMVGASTLLGFSPSWLSQTVNRQGRTLKTLRGLGFTGSQRLFFEITLHFLCWTRLWLYDARKISSLFDPA